jgi:hypothetical protein
MTPSIKFTMITWVVIIFLGSISFVSTVKLESGPIHHPKPAKGLPAVKLLTSRGCSDRSFADELNSQSTAEKQGQPVHMLAYHIDY